MIHPEWRERLALVTHDQHANLLERVISHYEPPPTITALQNCVKQAQLDEVFDGVVVLSEQITSRLATSMGLGESSAKTQAQQYPVYYRLCILLRGDSKQSLRRRFHTVLRHHAQRSPHTFSLNVQYEDVLALHRSLDRVSKALKVEDGAASLSELARSVHESFPAYEESLRRQRDGIQRIESGESAKVEAINNKISRAQELQGRALELLEDERALGDRKRDPGERGNTKARAAKQVFKGLRAPLLSEEMGDRLKRKINVHGDERLPEHETDIFERFAHRKLLAGDEPSDPAGPRLKIRHEVPYSNRVAQQSQERTSLTRLQNDTLVSGSDYHRLSPETLAHAFFWLYHAGDSAFVFGWLVATTGLPLKRLRATRIDSAPPVGELPHYDPESGALRYQILDGAAPTTSGCNRIVVLHLPDPLPRLIARMLESPGSDSAAKTSLFAAGRTTASAQLKYRFAETPGPPVTLRALKAGALEWLLPESRDEVEALLLTGQLGNYHGAADAYRSSTLNELNEVYRAVCTRLADCVLEREPGLRFLYEMRRNSRWSAGTNKRIGSARAVGPDHWRALFSDIRRRATAIELDVEAAPRLSQDKLTALISLYQHVTANAFIGWSLATAARPTSGRSTILLGQSHAFVVDKSTKAHLERREVPMVAPINQQITCARQLLEQIIELAHLLASVPIKRQAHPARVQLPQWLHRSRLGIRTEAIRMALVRQWSQDEDYVLHHWPINVARHSAVSMLRDRVSTVALDALLGHARGSRDAASTWSGLPLIDVFAELRPAIREMLGDVGYRPLKVGVYV